MRSSYLGAYKRISQAISLSSASDGGKRRRNRTCRGTKRGPANHFAERAAGRFVPGSGARRPGLQVRSDAEIEASLTETLDARGGRGQTIGDRLDLLRSPRMPGRQTIGMSLGGNMTEPAALQAQQVLSWNGDVDAYSVVCDLGKESATSRKRR